MESNNPKVSIITPIYNCEKYLERFIKSVFNQTISEFELILVDDRSPDLSFQKAQELASHDPRVIFIESDKNVGPMIARQKGYSVAKGEYLCFVDSDDELPTKALELLYNKAKESDSDIVAGTTLYIKTDGTEEYWPCNLPYGNDRDGILYALFKGKYRHNLCAKIFKRTAFESHVFDSVNGMKYFEDYLLFYQLVDVYRRFSIISDIVYNYYQNPGSSTQLNVDRKRLEDSYIAYSYVYNKYKDNDTQKCHMTSYMQKSIKTQYVLGYNKKGLVDEMVCKYGLMDVLKPSNIYKCNSYYDALKIYIGTSRMGNFLYRLLRSN